MKIKWGALVVDGRNKIGGQVASKNKAGSYLKNKVTPTNPNTTAQADVRANLTIVSRSWSALTPAEREAWNAYAAQYPYVDIFGDSKYLTGFAYFVKCNLNLLNAGSATINTPPASQDVTEVVCSVDDVSAPDSVSLFCSLASMPANHKVVVFASPMLSTGRVPSKSDLRQIKVASSITASLITCGDEYNAKFGDVVNGLRVGFGTYTINTNTGLVTQLRLFNTIASGS